MGTNDGTNKSLHSLLGDEPVADLGWDADNVRGKSVIDRQKMNEIICIDVGANSDPRDGRFLDFVSGMANAITPLSARMVVLVPTATNKSGGLVSAIKAASTYQNEGFNVRLVMNNRDGSGNYGDLKSIPTHLPTGYLEHLPIGLVHYRQANPGPILKIIREPSALFEMASKRIGNYLLRAARESWASDVFWWEDALASVPEADIDPILRTSIKTLRSVRNDQLLDNNELAEAIDQFKDAFPNSQHFLNLAKNLQKIL